MAAARAERTVCGIDDKGGRGRDNRKYGPAMADAFR